MKKLIASIIVMLMVTMPVFHSVSAMESVYRAKVGYVATYSILYVTTVITQANATVQITNITTEHGVTAIMNVTGSVPTLITSILLDNFIVNETTLSSLEISDSAIVGKPWSDDITRKMVMMNWTVWYGDSDGIARCIVTTSMPYTQIVMLSSTTMTTNVMAAWIDQNILLLGFVIMMTIIVYFAYSFVIHPHRRRQLEAKKVANIGNKRKEAQQKITKKH